MGPGRAQIEAFLARGPAVHVVLARVRGSSPREAGADMLVSAAATLGTIGGGQLEFMAMDEARALLASGAARGGMDVPLGPAIGQCCGGRVEVALERVGPELAGALTRRAGAEEALRPAVLVFGAGHVGHALARVLSLLPVRASVIDTRPEALAGLPEGVEAKATPMPEAMVRGAPEGAAYVILTHDHALDFLIAHEALKRKDAAYVGMIGSRTKRATFARWHKEQGGAPEALKRLTMPIGAKGLGDKRPEVIAALAGAEIIVRLGDRSAQARGGPATRSEAWEQP